MAMATLFPIWMAPRGMPSGGAAARAPAPPVGTDILTPDPMAVACFRSSGILVPAASMPLPFHALPPEQRQLQTHQRHALHRGFLRTSLVRQRRRHLCHRPVAITPASASEADRGHEAIDQASDDGSARDVASYWDLLRLSFGCFGVYLATPVLSLADSGFVGRHAGTEQLAALGPGTALCDSLLYVFSGLGVATTNLYASRRARRQVHAMRRVASDGLLLGLVGGFALGFVLFVLARPLMRLIQAEPSVIDHAASYTRLRALGMPAALLSTAAQAACIAERDSTSPVLVVVISGIVNVIGDAWLVPHGGVAGAGIATAFSQVVGAIFLLLVLKRRRQRFSAQRRESRPLGGTFKEPGHMFTIPGSQSLRRFTAQSVPVSLAILGKVIFLNSLVVAAAGLGTVPLAAHQIAISQFFLLCKAGDSLGSAAQAFVPAALAKPGKRPTQRLIVRLLQMSVAWAAVNVVIALVLPFMSQATLTEDPLVHAAVWSIAGCSATGLALHCTTLCLEGILLASQRGRWLAYIYWINSAVFGAALYFGSRTFHGGLLFIWMSLVVFQGVRLVQFWSRVYLDHWDWQRKGGAAQHQVA